MVAARRGVRRMPVPLVALAILAVFGSACTTSARPPSSPPLPDGTPVWMLGDSLAWPTAAYMRPLPYPGAAVGASGFTDRATTKILDNALALMDAHEDPTHVLVMGGLNDVKPGFDPQDIIDGIAELRGEMTSRGIETVLIAQPAWTHSANLKPVSDWINTQPNSIDCRGFAGVSTDGLHPSDYLPFAVCIDAALVDMGVIWTND